MKKPTTRRVQAVTVTALALASGLALSVLTSSAAVAADGMAGPYPITTEPASGLSDRQLINIAVNGPPTASPLSSIEIHLCNSADIHDQYTYSYDAGVCSATPLGAFSSTIDPAGSYGVPPGETTSVFTYTAVAGTTGDGLVTCGPGAPNCYLVYRVTNAAGEEYYYGQPLTYGSGTPTTTTTTVPATTTTVPATTTTTVPATTTTTAPATTTTTVPATTT